MKVLTLGLLVGAAMAAGIEERAPQNFCNSNPAVQSSISQMPPARRTSFCSSVLGYKPRTTTETVTVTRRPLRTTTETVTKTRTTTSKLTLTTFTFVTEKETVTSNYPGASRRALAAAAPTSPPTLQAREDDNDDNDAAAVLSPRDRESRLSGACSCIVTRSPRSTTTTTTTLRRPRFTTARTTTTTTTRSISLVRTTPTSTLTYTYTVCSGPNPSPPFRLRVSDVSPSSTDSFNNKYLKPTPYPNDDFGENAVDFGFVDAAPSPPPFNIDCVGRTYAASPHDPSEPVYLAAVTTPPNSGSAVYLLNQTEFLLYDSAQYARCRFVGGSGPNDPRLLDCALRDVSGAELRVWHTTSETALLGAEIWLFDEGQTGDFYYEMRLRAS